MSDSLDELRERLKHTTDEQALLLEITRRIAAGGSLGAMLPDITHTLLQGLKADGIRVVLIRPPMNYATGPAAGKMIRFDSLITRLVSEQGPLQIPDVASANGSDLSQLQGTLGAIRALPLTAQDTLQGVLWIAYEAPRASFSSTEETFLSIVAAQAALAIANAQAVEYARRGREQVAAILTSSVDPVLVIDAKECVLVLNPAAESALGVSASQSIGKPIDEVLAVESLVNLLKGVTENTEGVEWQNEAGHTFAPRVSDIKTDDGEPRGRVLVLRDITRYKNLRDNQSEFVSTVSHDLRSPLTYMHGYATMLPMVGELNEKQKGFAEKIVAGIAQMTDLVDKILDAGRLDPEGNYQLNREACDVTKVVTDVANTHMQPAEKKKLALNVHVDAGMPILNLDDMMLRRALNNLVDNAIKYTPDEGAITVAAHLKDNNVVLSVKDTGLGISEENQKHLFERFRRVRRREHQAVKGSGLGLFIVKNVAQRHGGDAWIESKEGEGSTFFIRIPLEGPNLVGADVKKA